MNITDKITITNKSIHKNPDCICCYNLSFMNEIINAKTKLSTLGISKNTIGVWKIKNYNYEYNR